MNIPPVIESDAKIVFVIAEYIVVVKIRRAVATLVTIVTMSL